jgi:AbrB family looped-hinge helix DNA binding protein
VITTLTGKNQITVPAELTRKRGLKPGTRLEWRETDRPSVLEVVILPDTSTVASSLRGLGNRFRKLPGSPVDRLVKERAADEEGER